ncbi:MAG: hypothetical protein ACI37R_02840 [Candidatus Avigastranaerophilus sp.]
MKYQMEYKIEDKLTELQGNLREIKSSLIILQQAIENNDEIINIEDIDNHLKILIEKFNTTIENMEKIL